MPDAQLVFLAPPSWDELVRRLTGRGTEPQDVIDRRLAEARRELAAEGEFDSVLVNHFRAGAGPGAGSLRLRLAGRSPTPWLEPSLPRGHHQPSDRRAARADSKYALVIYSAKRARQINAYYSQLGEGLLEYVGPLVETHVHEKPLSIAMREINEGLLTSEKIDQ